MLQSFFFCFWIASLSLLDLSSVGVWSHLAEVTTASKQKQPNSDDLFYVFTILSLMQEVDPSVDDGAENALLNQLGVVGGLGEVEVLVPERKITIYFSPLRFNNATDCLLRARRCPTSPRRTRSPGWASTSPRQRRRRTRSGPSSTRTLRT